MTVSTAYIDREPAAGQK